MAIPVPGIEFNQSDVGGQYLAKLQDLAQAVDAAVTVANDAKSHDDVLKDYLLLNIDDYKGYWSDLSGGLSKPATAYHDGKIWRLQNNLANVTTSEPSDANNDWAPESSRFVSENGALGLIQQWGLGADQSLIENTDSYLIDKTRFYYQGGGDAHRLGSSNGTGLCVIGLAESGNRYGWQIVGANNGQFWGRTINASGWGVDQQFWTSGNLQKTVSQIDTTAGRVSTVGHMGYGDSIRITSADDILNLPPIAGNGGNAKYYWGPNGVPINMPAKANAAGYVSRDYIASTYELIKVTSRFTGESYQNVKSAGVWSGWKPVGSGSGRKTAPVQVLTSVDEVSNDIEVDLDCSEYNVFLFDFSDVSISTSGAFNLNIIGVPTDEDDLFSCTIMMTGAGVKTGVNTLLNSALTAHWPSVPEYGTTRTALDIIEFYWNPLKPGQLSFYQSDERP
ncbi:hypothetical protein [Gilvimarinus agarilyticus]|uniref:hypothetical protein n=1 Tax=Gilvimarinus agarilyticus TaxID=679259 RepID=UPI0005A0D656|nr:hypothetical protein [Gilvimarinus agarilyticus]